MLVQRIIPVAEKRLVTVNYDEPVTIAAGLLNYDGHINLAVVCDKGGRMAGIVTKTDIVRLISTCGSNVCATAVGDVMTKDVTYCRPGDRLAQVVSVMKEKSLLHVPVVDEDLMPLGVINVRDALQALWEQADHDESLLRDYVLGIGYR